MLKRLKMTHEALMLGTSGKFNILENPEFEYLKKIID
jgi:hypothetical protein